LSLVGLEIEHVYVSGAVIPGPLDEYDASVVISERCITDSQARVIDGPVVGAVGVDEADPTTADTI
jgi:hypothetical protein